VPPRDGAPPTPPILVVSADPRTRDRCCSILERAGLAAAAAPDGMAAFRYLAAEPCSLVLVDRHLPGVTPAVVAAAVRATFGAAPPVVLLALVTPGPLPATKPCPVGRVRAPIEPAELLRAVRAALG
jgi:CheY-like chemotaxis protein